MLSFFPRDVLDEISELIESVSGGLLAFSWLILFESDRVLLLRVHPLLQHFVVGAGSETFRFLGVK